MVGIGVMYVPFPDFDSYFSDFGRRSESLTEMTAAVALPDLALLYLLDLALVVGMLVGFPVGAFVGCNEGY